MIQIERKKLELMLEALERYQVKRQDFITFDGIIATLEEALAKPDQEPVATYTCGVCGVSMQMERPWVGLTDEDVMAIGRELGLKCRLGGNKNIDFDYAQAVEAKLKEKNSTT